MTDLVINREYRWKGIDVRLRHLDNNAASVTPSGSTHVIFVDANELSPVPSKSEKLSTIMSFTEEEWTRAVELADKFKEALTAASGKTDHMKSVAKEFKLSLRATYNLLKRYRLDSSPHALLPGKPGRRAGSRVLAVSREKVIASVIDAHFLRPEKPTAAAICGDIKIACERAGLPNPSPNTVRKRIKNTDLRRRIAARDGKKRSREICDPAAGHLLLTRPLERVEIDHTLVDCMLVSDTKERKLLGRPWITVAIDCFSRMVLGFYVTFDHPSSKSVALCIAHALLPKDEWLKAHGVPGTWPCFGFPDSIWVDNAMEFRAIALRRGCETHGIKLCYRPAGEPQVGGMIERLIGTVMGRVHLLPGTTQSNIAKRGKYDPAANAQMTLREFVTWLTSQIVTQYHTSTHRGLGKPPLVAWQQACESSSPTEPGAPLEILANFLPATTRILRRTGVEINRTNYWGDAFSPYVGEKHHVIVHDYPLDLEHVFVRLPNGELTIATAKHSTATPKTTVLDHLLQKKEDRELEDDPELKQIRSDGHALCQGIMQRAKDETKAAKQKKPQTQHVAKEPTMALYRPPRGINVTIEIEGD